MLTGALLQAAVILACRSMSLNSGTSSTRWEGRAGRQCLSRFLAETPVSSHQCPGAVGQSFGRAPDRGEPQPGRRPFGSECQIRCRMFCFLPECWSSGERSSADFGCVLLTRQRQVTSLTQACGSYDSGTLAVTLTIPVCSSAQCGFHGTSGTGACVCDPGWSGIACNVPLCTPACVHGVCGTNTLSAPPTCLCDAGASFGLTRSRAHHPRFRLERSRLCDGAVHAGLPVGRSVRLAGVSRLLARGGTGQLPGQRHLHRDRSCDSVRLQARLCGSRLFDTHDNGVG